MLGRKITKKLTKEKSDNPSSEKKSSVNLKKLSNNLELNISFLKNYLKDCADVVFRAISLSGRQAYIIYTDNMINSLLLTEVVLKNILNNAEIFAENNSIDEKIKETLPTGQVALENDVEECVTAILSGGIILVVDGFSQAVNINLPGREQRSIANPEVEPGVRGPKESFTENLNTNTTLIRRRLVHHDFKVVNLTIGHYSRTRMSVLYISSLANEKLVAEVFNRLKKVNTDSLLDIAYIEELIEDAPYSPFPTIQVTERPDKVASSLLEGRIAILQDNTPFGLIIPVVFASFFQAAEDYYNRYFLGTILRYLRYFGFAITILLPALFVAITTFNQEMIPTKLIVALAIQREGIPFPAAVEALIMIIAFEILREAGSRLPKGIGQAVSIVGALIIGDSAVKAGLVSPAMVIVIALTAISSFTMPSVQLNDSIFLSRLMFLFFSSFLGFWGIFMGLLLIMGHLASIRSLGIPYTAPISPLNTTALEDVLARAPQWVNKKNVSIFHRKNSSLNREAR